KFDESSKGVIICLYVDDMPIIGIDQVQVDLTKEFLSLRFSMKDMGEVDVILAHLDNNFPLNEDIKIAEEVKYGEFRRPFPKNGGNGDKYRVGPPGYYTHVDNRPPFGETKPSLEELMNKHIKESTRKRNENE
nr:zinc finger, CCHC-type [Tanacetum cinerariifolium]